MSRTSTETPGGARRISLNGPTMGSRWTAVWFDDGRPDPMEIGRALCRAVGAVDDQMSTWKHDSDLMRFNRAAVGEWAEIPANLAQVLDAGVRIGEASRGAFDMGVGRLVAEWGFGSHAGIADMLPTAPGRTDVGSLQVDVAGRRVRKFAPVALDLSGIAKGFGVDELARVLEEAGLDAFLVGIDGEIRARGRKPDGSTWAVAVERPEVGVRGIRSVVELTDGAIATSGAYRHVRADGDGQVTHTIDPRTGRPLRNGIVSVTVVAPTAMTADAAATALMVLGPEEGPVFAERIGVDALMLRTKEDGESSEVAVGRFRRTAVPEGQSSLPIGHS